MGQNPGPLVKFLKKQGTVPQYTMFGTPYQNGIAERKNRMLKEMARAMICYYTLLIFLWDKTIKTAMYILNRIPTKAVQKTPRELWTSRKLSLGYIRIWGCLTEAKIYNPQEKAFDLKMTSGFSLVIQRG